MRNIRIGGFTLIELMITVIILSILAAIAYPAYTNWTTQTRRSDAHIALTNIAALQEKFFTECNAYASSLTAARTCAAGGLDYGTTLSPDSHYALNVDITAATTGCANDGDCFFSTADPDAGGTTGLQASDGDIRITSRGLKQWDRDDSGVFDANENSWR